MKPKEAFCVVSTVEANHIVKRMTELRIDGTEEGSLLHYTGTLEGRTVAGSFGLTMAELVSAKAFRRIYGVAKYFVSQTILRLHLLRKRLLIVQALYYIEIKRLSLASTAIRHLINEKGQSGFVPTLHILRCFRHRRS